MNYPASTAIEIMKSKLLYESPESIVLFFLNEDILVGSDPQPGGNEGISGGEDD